MTITKDQIAGLNVALNEADWHGLEVDPVGRTAIGKFRVLTLPEVGPAPEDPFVQIKFFPVGRVAASLRNGRWDNPDAEVIPFALYEITPVILSFVYAEIYGWEFFDRAEPMKGWAIRLSLDWSSGQDGLAHSVFLFQEDDRILDLCVWFDEMEVRDMSGTRIDLDEFIAGGKRAWDAMGTGDRRLSGGHPQRKPQPWKPTVQNDSA